jgi:hypothetical protein
MGKRDSCLEEAEVSGTHHRRAHSIYVQLPFEPLVPEQTAPACQPGFQYPQENVQLLLSGLANPVLRQQLLTKTLVTRIKHYSCCTDSLPAVS